MIHFFECRHFAVELFFLSLQCTDERGCVGYEERERETDTTDVKDMFSVGKCFRPITVSSLGNRVRRRYRLSLNKIPEKNNICITTVGSQPRGPKPHIE